MSDKLYYQTVAERGNVINSEWLQTHMCLLEHLPVFAGFSWGWCSLMTDDPLEREAIAFRAQAAFNSKPLGCELCEEKEATTYHCYAGRVCPDCRATLPNE